MQTFNHQKFLYWKEIASKWKYISCETKFVNIPSFSFFLQDSEKKDSKNNFSTNLSKSLQEKNFSQNYNSNSAFIYKNSSFKYISNVRTFQKIKKFSTIDLILDKNLNFENEILKISKFRTSVHNKLKPIIPFLKTKKTRTVPKQNFIHKKVNSKFKKT